MRKSSSILTLIDDIYSVEWRFFLVAWLWAMINQIVATIIIEQVPIQIRLAFKMPHSSPTLNPIRIYPFVMYFWLKSDEIECRILFSFSSKLRL